MSKNSKSNDSGIGLVLVLIVAIVAMPIVGMYLIGGGESKGEKYLGVALLIVSVIVYIKLGMV